jgi:membrane protease YdiL (CAAX protease family)
MFYVSGSLWTSIAMHFVNNGSAVLLYYLNNKGVINVDVDHFGAMSLSVTALSAVAVVGIIVWSWRKKETEGTL